MRWQLDAAPVVAILRGVLPDEVLDIADALIRSGIRAIEVPMNSPEPLQSIRRLSEAFGETCVCGAGTVLDPRDVDAAHAAGAALIVSPNTDQRVIRQAVGLGLEAMPGFATATEAFTAIEAGARHLKLFPAATYGPAHVRALRAVLPSQTKIYAVGGVGLSSIAAWTGAGIDGLGIGTDLFRPGWTASQVAERASAVVAAFRGAAS
jgi:2-dehydro-3-deoxyphosphogalactonate aldolase